MQEFWKTYMVPVTVSGIGLVLAFILGIAPLIGNDTVSAPLRAATSQMAEQASAIEDLRTAHATEVAALRQTLAVQTRTISDLENRIANLDRGVIRNFWRSKENTDFIDGIGGVGQRLGDLENRIANLDRGVTRTFWRSKENADVIEALAGANQRLSDLETQMNTLNAAVPRISARVRDLQGAID